MIRVSVAASLSVATARSATRRGKMGVGCAQIIWRGMEGSSSPAIGGHHTEQTADAQQKQDGAE
jgi:hypothetical protein